MRGIKKEKMNKTMKIINFTPFLAFFVILLLPTISAEFECGNDVCEYGDYIRLNIGQSGTLEGRTITFVDIGIGSSIAINVDDESDIINENSFKVMKGIEVWNNGVSWQYSGGWSIYTASIGVREDVEACPEDCAGLTLSYLEVSNFCDDDQISSETNEELPDCGGWCNRECTNAAFIRYFCFDGIKNKNESDIDCGGTECNVCLRNEACEEHNDCQSGRCYGGKCLESCFEEIPKPRCDKRGEFLQSLGLDKGCLIGYTCCGDNICSLDESEESCPLDCKVKELQEEEQKELIDEEPILENQNKEEKKKPFFRWLMDSISNFFKGLFDK